MKIKTDLNIGKEIAFWRSVIDSVDLELLKLLAVRMDVCKQIGFIKQSTGISISDKEREEEMLLRRQKMAERLGLNKEFVVEIMNTILRQSKEIQRRVKSE